MLGVQAAQLIRDAEDPLLALKQLTQNFPKYAASLARRVVVDDDLFKEIETNLMKAQAGVNMIWLNGLPVLERDLNPFAYVPSYPFKFKDVLC